MATIHTTATTMMTGLVSKQISQHAHGHHGHYNFFLSLLGAAGQSGGTFQPEILYYTATDGLQYAYYYDEQGNIVYPDYGSYQTDGTAQGQYDQSAYDGTVCLVACTLHP